MLRNDGLTAQLSYAKARTDANKLRVEELNKLLIFGRICHHKAVLLADGPLVWILEPTAHDILKLNLLRNRVFLLRNAERTRWHTMFAESADIKSLAFGLVWIEMIARFAFGNTPLWIMVDRQNICPKFLGYPLRVFLVFLSVEGASGVNQDTSWFEGVPYII